MPYTYNRCALTGEMPCIDAVNARLRNFQYARIWATKLIRQLRGIFKEIGCRHEIFTAKPRNGHSRWKLLSRDTSEKCKT